MIGERDVRRTLPGHHTVPQRAPREPALAEQLLRGEHEVLQRYASALKLHHHHGRGVRALHRLRWAGWLDSLAGLLIGRSAAPDSTGPTNLRYREALQSTLATLPCPVLVDVDIGHRPPQLLLVNGALAELRWSAAEGGRVLQRFV